MARRRELGVLVAFNRRLMQPALLREQTPNPSIEGMPKRLRLLCTPHVKR
jgi:hypothetical protein